MSQPPEYPPGYGAPPPAYPPPGDHRLRLGEALRWAWRKFAKNALAMIVPAFLYWLLLHVTQGLLDQKLGVLTAFNDTDDDTGAGFNFGFAKNLSGGQLTLLLLLGYLIMYAVWAFAICAFLSGCLDIADGRPVTIGSFFKPRNLDVALPTALLAGFLLTVATLLFIVPGLILGIPVPGLILAIIAGLILGILLQFAVPFAIDRSQSAVDATKSSFSLTSSRFTESLLVWLAAGFILFLGELACGVGSAVAIPVASLLVIYAYRRLSGGHVAPLEQPGYQPAPPPPMPPGL